MAKKEDKNAIISVLPFRKLVFEQSSTVNSPARFRIKGGGGTLNVTEKKDGWTKIIVSIY